MILKTFDGDEFEVGSILAARKKIKEYYPGARKITIKDDQLFGYTIYEAGSFEPLAFLYDMI